ncbi:hypothetical protein J6590_069797 [Homalodisca vitripennis]|nr:hypothetical protein J6590_069797 [Homalodisca vitripennis]
MSDNIVNHPSELDRQLDVDLSDDDWSDVSSIFSDETDVDPIYRSTTSDSDDEEMPFSQLSTSRGNAAARPTPDNDQPASPRHSDLHQHNTRHASDFALPPHHLSLYKRKPSYKGAAYFNHLPEHLKNQPPHRFKKQLTLWLQERPFYTEEEFTNS